MSEVRIEHVRQAYGTVVALDDVSLTIPPGTFLSLLGASGAGKSTLLRILGGFEKPLSGRVFLGGEDITALPPYRRRVNTVFQDYALFPHMSVAENVAYGLKREGLQRGEVQHRVMAALGMLQIESLSARRPSQLSGGQQQRVALARALVKRPPVLLLDEPLGALDRQLRQHVQIELKQLQRKLGTTFVFVTHDQEEALALSDQVAVMRDGRIEQLDSPTSLYDNPCNAFVAGFIGQNNFLPGGQSAVRPEHMRLVTSDVSPAPNAVRGTITAAVVLGETMQYVLVSDDAQHEMIVRTPRHRGEALRREGDACWAVWDERDVRVFST